MNKKDVIVKFEKYFAFAIPIIITVFMLSLHLVRFSSVDDMYMVYLSDSFKTNPTSEHLFFISVVYGYIIKLLNNLTSTFNWFCILEIFAVNVAFVSLFKIVEKYKYDIVAVMALSCFQIVILNQLSFTALSFILPIIGALWAISFVEKLSKKNIIHIVYAFVLMLMGFGFRWGSTLYCVIIMLVPVLFFCFKNKKNSFAVLGIILILCCVSNYAVKGIEKVYIAHNPEPEMYSQFNEYRSAAYDRPQPDYENNKESLQKVGLSENDVNLFFAALYGDENVFTPEAVKTIAECRSFNETYETNPVTLIKNFFTNINPVNNFALVLLGFAVLAFISLKNRRMEVLFTFLFSLANIGFLFVRNRALPRVYNPIAISAMILLLNIYLQEKDNLWNNLKTTLKFEKIKQVCVVLSVIAFLGISVLNVYYIDAVNYNTNNICEELRKDTDHVYVANAYTRNYMHNRKLTVLRKNFMDVPVIVTMGEWYIYSNYWNDYHHINNMDEYVNTPYLYLLEDNVRFITEMESLPDSINTFFEENYSLKTNYRLEKEMYDNNKKTTYYVYNFYYVD